jgi:uncharacterized protein YdeI (BOF family)
MNIQVMRRVSGLLISVLLASGCHKSQGTVLGTSQAGEPRTILSIKAGDTAPQVTLSGVMIEKCPVAGCWFRLRDGTGVIRVDTKLAGFVVVDLPLDTKMTVAGKVVANDNEVAIEATGLRY